MTADWLEHLTGAISKRSRRQDARPRYAAVLVPIVLVEGELSLLLTRRTERLSTHKGHVAFRAVGRMKPTKMLKATALREAQEEVGLPSHHVSILGQLDDFPTVTDDMIVTPVVGYIETLPRLAANPLKSHGSLRSPSLCTPSTRRVGHENIGIRKGFVSCLLLRLGWGDAVGPERLHHPAVTRIEPRGRTNPFARAIRIVWHLNRSLSPNEAP